MKYGISPLYKLLKVIENIKFSLLAKRNLENPTNHISYDDYKNHPECKTTVDEIIKKFKQDK